MPANSFIRLEGIAFRAASPRDGDVLQATVSSRRDPGRFNTSSFGAFYLACDPDTAIAELRRTVQRNGRRLADAHPCSLHFVRLAIRSAVDLTTPNGRSAWGLSMSDLSSDDVARCQTVAANALRAGAEGIRWPSATGSGESLALFADHLDESSLIETIDGVQLDCDALDALERGECIGEIATLPAWQAPRSA